MVDLTTNSNYTPSNSYDYSQFDETNIQSANATKNVAKTSSQTTNVIANSGKAEVQTLFSDETPLAAPNQEVLTNSSTLKEAQNALDIIKRIKESSDFGKYNDITSLNSDGISLLCMLLTQESKSTLIQSLKKALESKTAERDQVQKKYLEEKNKAIDEKIAADKAQKAAKKKSFWGKIFGAIASVIGTVVAVAATPFTGGASLVAAGLMITACVASLASTACSIAADCVSDENVKKKLGYAALGLGIGSAVLGIAGAAAAVKTAATASLSVFANKVKTGGQITSALCQIAQGSLQMVQASSQMKLAEIEKSLADTEIQLEKLDSSIEFLEEFIKMLMSNSKEFINLFLQTEENAANEMVKTADAQLALASAIKQNA